MRNKMFLAICITLMACSSVKEDPAVNNDAGTPVGNTKLWAFLGAVEATGAVNVNYVLEAPVDPVQVWAECSSTDSTATSPAAFVTFGNDKKSGIIKVTGLTPNISSYSCRVNAIVNGQTVTSEKTMVFTTTGGTTNPTISIIGAVSTKTDRSATITWFAQNPSSVRAECGKVLTPQQYVVTMGSVPAGASTDKILVLNLEAFTDYFCRLYATRDSATSDPFLVTFKTEQASVNPTDTQNPTITLSDPTDTTVTSSPVTFIGGATDDGQVTNVICSVLVGGALNIKTFGTNLWQTSATLVETGSTIFSCKSYDAAGKESQAVLKKFIYNPIPTNDTTPPTVNVLTSNNTQTTSNSATIYGTAFDVNGVAKVVVTNVATGVKVEVVSSAFSGSVTNPGWTMTVALPVTGDNVFSVIAVDTAGLTSLVTYQTFKVVAVNNPPTDTQRPTISLDDPSDVTTTSGAVSFNGKASDSDGQVVSVSCIYVLGSGSGIVSPGTTTWTAGAMLANGVNLISCMSKDSSGKTSDPVNKKFIVNQPITGDTTAPTLNNVSYTSNSQATPPTATIYGSATDAGGVAKVVVTNVTTGAAITITSFTGSATSPGFSTSVPFPVVGANVFSVVAQDLSGNVSPVVHVTIPVTTGTTPTGNFVISCNSTASTGCQVHAIFPSLPGGVQEQTVVSIPFATLCSGAKQRSDLDEVIHLVGHNLNSGTWSSGWIQMVGPGGNLITLTPAASPYGNNLMATTTALGCGTTPVVNNNGTTGGTSTVTQPTTPAGLMVSAAVASDGSLGGIWGYLNGCKSAQVDLALDQNMTTGKQSFPHGTPGQQFGQIAVPKPSTSAPTTYYYQFVCTENSGNIVRSGVATYSVASNSNSGATGKYEFVVDQSVAGQATIAVWYPITGADAPARYNSRLSLSVTEVCTGPNVSGNPEFKIMATTTLGPQYVRIYNPSGVLIAVNGSPILPLGNAPYYNGRVALTSAQLGCQ